MVKVSFRAQGNSEWQQGVAVARRGSQLLIQYTIKSGAARERWLPADRFSVPDGGDLNALPVAPYERNARSFKATLPDGRKITLSSERDQTRAAVSFSITDRHVTIGEGKSEPGKWTRPGWHLATRAEAEALIAERLERQTEYEQQLQARGHAMNMRTEYAVVEVREHVKKAKS